MYLNIDRAGAWQSKSIAQGVSLCFNAPGREFFEQLYENEAAVNRAVSINKRKEKLNGP